MVQYFYTDDLTSILTLKQLIKCINALLLLCNINHRIAHHVNIYFCTSRLLHVNALHFLLLQIALSCHWAWTTWTGGPRGPMQCTCVWRLRRSFAVHSGMEFHSLCWLIYYACKAKQSKSKLAMEQIKKKSTSNEFSLWTKSAYMWQLLLRVSQVMDIAPPTNFFAITWKRKCHLLILHCTMVAHVLHSSWHPAFLARYPSSPYWRHREWTPTWNW